jgi:hypothetical protein
MQGEFLMRADRGQFLEGGVTVSEPAPGMRLVEALVDFPNVDVDPWEKILHDPAPRPELTKLVEEVRAEIAARQQTATIRNRPRIDDHH